MWKLEPETKFDILALNWSANYHMLITSPMSFTYDGSAGRRIKGSASPHTDK
jgi:hypothetical protein